MDNKTDRKSPNLEVISKGSEIRNHERRHLPRLSLTSEQFRLNRDGKLFSVSDLSRSGMGIWLLNREDAQHFSVGLLLEGILNLKRQKYHAKVRVRNMSPDRIGCEFEDPSEEIIVALADLLNPELLGKELKPLPSSEMTSLWYHGPTGTDLLFRRMADGNYQRFTLYVLGTFIQWDQREGLSTGRTLISNERSELRGILRLETLLLDSDPTPAPDKLSIAKTVILSSNLPLDLKGWCVRQLER